MSGTQRPRWKPHRGLLALRGGSGEPLRSIRSCELDSPHRFHRKSTKKSGLCTEENALSASCSIAFGRRAEVVCCVSRVSGSCPGSTCARKDFPKRGGSYADRFRAPSSLDAGVCVVRDHPPRRRPDAGAYGRFTARHPRHLPGLQRQIHPRSGCREGGHPVCPHGCQWGLLRSSLSERLSQPDPHQIFTGPTLDSSPAVLSNLLHACGWDMFLA